MKTRLKTRALLPIAGVGLLLLGTAWLAQAAITITRADGWICTDGTIDVQSNSVIPVDASCSAPPLPGNFSLTVSKAGTGTGTVSGTGFSCGADCTESYPENTSINVTLTAAASAGSSFTGWSGAGCTGAGACTVATTITSNLSVTATFTADAGPPGACGTTPPNVTVVDTGNLNVAWPTMMFEPAPATVMAFRVHAPSGFAGRSDFRATRLPPATKGKAIVVSSCPGSVQPVAANSCTLQNVTDSALLRLSANSSDTQFIYCKLTPGQTYYINAFSKNLPSDSDSNCPSGGSTCKFQAFRGQPY